MARRRKNHGSGGHESSERWLLTYADMITLLLALFILLYAMSTINPKTFDSLKKSLSSEFHGQIVDGSHDVTNGSSSIMDSATPADTQDQTNIQIQQQSTEHEGQQISTQTAQLQKALAKSLGAASANSSATQTAELAQKGVQVALTPEGIDIHLAGDTFFESGSADLNPQATAVLAKVAKQLHGRRNLNIVGHTDGAQISGSPFPNNLALSGARASAVATFLIDNGISEDAMQSKGMGARDPLVTPPTPTASVAKNRSVDIVIAEPPAAAQSALRDATTGAPTVASPGPAGSAGPANPPAIKPIDPISPIIDSVVEAGGG